MAGRIVSSVDDEAKIIEMSEMKPLQVGRVVGGIDDGHILFRTCRVDIFEAIDLTDMHQESCWLKPSDSVGVELLPIGEKVILELYNE